MKIAVFVDKKGNTVSYHTEGIIEVYTCDGSNWHCAEKTSLGADQSANISEVRERIHAVMAEIEDAKVFVVDSMKSLPIAIFDGYGITVWNHKGIPAEAFNYIKEQEENKAHQPKSCCDTPSCKSTCSSNAGECASSLPITFNNIGKGLFSIDLAKALAGGSSLNSKQILIPFMQNTEFTSLEIICEHLPKWFDKELGIMSLHYELNVSTDGLCHVIVSHKK